jgi:hypothetical protein
MREVYAFPELNLAFSCRLYYWYQNQQRMSKLSVLALAITGILLSRYQFASQEKQGQLAPESNLVTSPTISALLCFAKFFVHRLPP